MRTGCSDASSVRPVDELDITLQFPPPPHYFFWSTAPAGLTVGSAPLFLKYARLSGQALLNYTVTRTKTPHGAPPPDTCKHSRHDRIAGVCLVGKEKWAEIWSCDPPVCLRLYHSDLTAVILFKQRQMASGKVRKRVHLPLSIYIAISASLTIFHCFLCKKKLLRKESQRYIHFSPSFVRNLVDRFPEQNHYFYMFIGIWPPVSVVWSASGKVKFWPRLGCQN